MPEGYDDLTWVTDTLKPTRIVTKKMISTTPKILDIMRKTENHTLEGIYLSYCKYFFPLVRSGLKSRGSAEYQRHRRVAYDLSEKIYGDQNHWYTDYQEYYNKNEQPL